MWVRTDWETIGAEAREMRAAERARADAIILMLSIMNRLILFIEV